MSVTNAENLVAGGTQDYLGSRFDQAFTQTNSAAAAAAVDGRMKTLYLLAALVGAIAPYAVYFGYLAYVPGSSGALSLAWGNPIAAATLADFTISCLVFWPFLIAESRKLAIRHWWLFILANIFIGLSFALPAFLYIRERRLANVAS